MLPQTKVFVGSLPQGSKPEELRKLFERFGVVTECDIMNRCGFVHMQTEEQATAAIRALNNSSFNGGVISVERGRIKERGQRGGGGGRGGRGGMRGGMDRRGGGPMRGGMSGGRDAPYMRDARPMGHMRGPSAGMGRSMGYDRGPERAPPPPAPYDDRYAPYAAEDRRGFALMDRAPRDPYQAPAPMYQDERYASHISVVDSRSRGYGGADEMGMYADDRRAPMYDDRERDLIDRRPPPRTAALPATSYDRMPQRQPPMGNGDMYSRRSPMRGGAPGPGAYDRDPYAQQYAPMGRERFATEYGGGAPRGREHGGGMAARRY